MLAIPSLTLDDLRHLTGSNKSAADGVEIKGPGILQNTSSARRGNRACHVERACHARKQHHRLPLPFPVRQARNVPRHARDVRSDGVLKCPARGAWTARHFSHEGSDRTPIRDIVAVFRAEIRTDERLELASAWRRLGGPNQPLRHLLETNLERLREEIFLAAEVPVKPAMRQPEVSHQIRDRRALAAATPKAAGGGLDDARPRFLFVLGWVSQWWLRDDVYHLYRLRQPIRRTGTPSRPRRTTCPRRPLYRWSFDSSQQRTSTLTVDLHST